MPPLRKLLIGTGVVVAGAGAFVATRPTPPKPAPFHVAYPPLKISAGGRDLFPCMHAMMSRVPEHMRKKFIVKMGAPKGNEMKDRYDCIGENPYTITEVVPDRMWRVKYETSGTTMFANKDGKRQAKFFGIDPNDPAYRARVLAGAAQYGDEAVKVAEKDIEKSVELFAKESFTNEELISLSLFSLNSFIVKLKSGGLFIYAPVKIRAETGFAEWVDSLGKVEYIAIASGAHTLNLQPVIQRYPDAKVIGPPQAEAKLNFISALPRGKVDFDSTNAKDLAAVNKLLEVEGVKFYDVAGDVVTNALVAVYDNQQLMSCDLIYTHADGQGFLDVDKERFGRLLPEDWFFRLFRFNTTAIPNSPSGFLPNYRYQLMDPNCLGVMVYDKPALDGSSCTTMAESLRDLVKVKFEFANGVHFDQMTAEEYREAMDKNWNWLDGKPLICGN